MPPTTPFDFGDVVLVPFPFTDQSSSKKRPAVVVSSEAYQQDRSDLIVAAITSQPRGDRFGEVTIAAWRQAGLLRPSVIKPVITTLDRRLVILKLGRLNEVDRIAPSLAMNDVLGR